MQELIAYIVCILTGVQARWFGCDPDNRQRIYFANHTSHLDFLVLWAVLPTVMRNNTWAAAASDYWEQDGIRKYLSSKVFPVVTIERENVTKANNPITKLVSVLDRGNSLIIFPEGGRMSDDTIHEFKSGIFHLAKKRPAVDFIPVFIDNASRILPKGEFLPIPLICTVTFGSPLNLESGELKESFLTRTHQALTELKSEGEHG